MKIKITDFYHSDQSGRKIFKDFRTSDGCSSSALLLSDSRYTFPFGLGTGLPSTLLVKASLLAQRLISHFLLKLIVLCTPLSIRVHEIFYTIYHYIGRLFLKVLISRMEDSTQLGQAELLQEGNGSDLNNLNHDPHLPYCRIPRTNLHNAEV